MSFQISIGDAILLAQIALRLAQTFTKGRKSAPVEFQEIENELYSLSAALAAVKNERDSVRLSADQMAPGNNQHIAAEDIFAHILQNCRHTLTHLEELVKKYMIVSEQTDPQKPKLERWSHSLMKNWRKIEWTTEKGDLNTLRSQIMVHINSLNLLVNISTSSRAASIERSLDKKLVLLEELHQWYVDNLKEIQPKRSHSPGSLIWESGATTHAQGLGIVSTFELAKKNEVGHETICPYASIRSDWIESFLDGTLDPNSGSMFVCSCLDHHPRTMSHQPTVQRYGLSHLIFPIRIASDDISWVLYRIADTANNELVDLYIRNIHPSYIRRLEDTLFRSLSSRRSDAILTQGQGNSLCYISAENQEEHILEAMGDLNISRQSVESITFQSGRSRHIQEWITDVQILQYGVRNLGTVVGNTQGDLVRSLEYAEILISFDADEAQERDDVASMVLKLRRNTTTVLTEKASVEIKSIEAVGTHSDERTTTHEGLDVIIQFTTKPAREFHDKIEAMRMELFVKSLQYPSSNEKVVLNLQTARVECERAYIDDAEITIVVDADAKYRLIITSRNGCTIISQVLVADFFTSLSNGLNFTGPTYLVQIGDTGERKVYHYKNGFRHLNLSTRQANHMLELARSSVSFAIRNSE
ncbi:hypothetical protein GQX73_g3181 [Xylaria multiplex]|uniref:NACHT-NTPase and P-loop NTPases N-terminal domain-containing protein n=1 Tax=Xylaria multiplex TaxID=323545 RepID=A0A7C8IXR4_9PEZI|nr:hypothetical protein GQX73_g3181 [Xylaria multiplex]